MTVSEKHMEAARHALNRAWEEHESKFGGGAHIVSDGLMESFAVAAAAALAAAEREGMRRAAGIASQCGVDAVEFAKKHIGERHIDFLRFQDGCEASAAAIRNQANTHYLHALGIVQSAVTRRGEVAASPSQHRPGQVRHGC